MITGLLALLASTTFIWAISIAVIILMAILLEYEKEGWATTFFSLGIALVLWNFKASIWEFFTSNPTTAITFCVSYVLIGIFWSFLKWRSYVKTVFDKFNELKAKFINKNGLINDENREAFNNEVTNARFKESDGHIAQFYKKDTLTEIGNKISPLASEKKSVITAWISYWPVSLAGTLLNNPFRKFFEWIYSLISGSYDKITNKYKTDAFGA